MKTKIKVCYAGSGVNFTHSLSVAFIVFGILFLLGALILFVTADGYEVYVSLAVTLLIMFVISLAISAVLEAMSSVAKTALYKRAVMEAEYEFEDSDSGNGYGMRQVIENSVPLNQVL